MCLSQKNSRSHEYPSLHNKFFEIKRILRLCSNIIIIVVSNHHAITSFLSQSHGGGQLAMEFSVAQNTRDKQCRKSVMMMMNNGVLRVSKARLFHGGDG